MKNLFKNWKLEEKKLFCFETKWIVFQYSEFLNTHRFKLGVNLLNSFLRKKKFFFEYGLMINNIKISIGSMLITHDFF